MRSIEQSVKNMEIENYEQKTGESCLSACLLMMLKSRDVIKKMTREEELKILMHGITFYKWDISIGQLNYVARKYGTKISLYVENRSAFYYFSKLKNLKNLKLINRKIDIKVVSSTINKNPLLYVDAYDIYGINHYPHYILLTSKKNNKFFFLDPWDGISKSMSSKQLMRTINNLRSYIKISPRLIVFE